MQESEGKRGLHPVQERHTECDELSSYRSSIDWGTMTSGFSSVRAMMSMIIP